MDFEVDVAGGDTCQGNGESFMMRARNFGDVGFDNEGVMTLHKFCKSFCGKMRQSFAIPFLGAAFSVISFLLMPGSALAENNAVPKSWQVDFMPAASSSMVEIMKFHDLLLVIITGIVIVVLALLLFVMVRFRASRNPTPSQTSHNTLIEIIWTVIPVMVLVVIAIPSFRLLYFVDRTDKPELTLKVTGYQWYWGYEYPDHNITFDSNMVQDKDLKPGQVRLLSVDNPIVLPVDTNIQILTTAADVIHSWAVPSFGVKIDSVPGRTNETWFRVHADKAGTTFFGQCSELCGAGHAYMPIEIRMVTKEEFQAWLASKQQSYLPRELRENDPQNLALIKQ